MKRAAHFLLLPELARSPPNDALISALLELGYEIDVFAPGGGADVSDYCAAIRVLPVEYGYRWLARNALSLRWRRYALFSGTTEDPMGVAGNLARLHGRPHITLADEIKNGSYSGNRGHRWKALCRRGMRKSHVTIVNESRRVEIQREYAGMSDKDAFTVYPGCYRKPPESRGASELRTRRGIPLGAPLVCYSGVFNEGNGALWLSRAVEQANPSVWFWAQIGTTGLLTRQLLKRARGGERLVVEDDVLPWREAWASMGAADIGIVVYLQDAPQFRNMGIASNRLCMFLSMGVPVIASRQESFAFIEDYECGVLVETEEEFVEAIDHIAGTLEDMKANAIRCAREYIDAPGRYAELKRLIAEI